VSDMRQAVEVGRQILKIGIQSEAAMSSTNVWVGWRPKTFNLPFQTLRYIGMAAHFAERTWRCRRPVLSDVSFEE
jgi:hypothetical protein